MLDVLVPLAVYYGLRAAGAGIYLSLLGGAAGSVAGAAVALARTRRVTALTGYVLTMMVLSTAVALIAGSPRFLLAREGWITGVTGVWFIASLAAPRPLVYLFSRPLLEGRLRWPPAWDRMWERSPRFRRMWRTSSLLWGVATLTDSAARVVMAYTMPVDLVPALGTALYVATSVVIVVVTNLYYITAGVFNRDSAMYRE
ncbi:VC0807 family protein [Amycolatopsis sp. PS_44_ISF1]|uniref:VC0807 family protein n=1 Tax=Amycolatopsis sp. PS_44_ISF1 TaxID=2974917 RepID=UPI0028DEC708|nr:VC0807 family protein [Amycolatopsis sp. PS_44_ISF1]MDT8912233.1 hypothetical protein [Amycolatopsis sp. PS_44_ISF1]